MIDKTVRIHPDDNVAVRPDGHKVALRDIKSGEFVIKYGFPIGRATSDIKTGEHVHSHNLRSALAGINEYTYTPDARLADWKTEDDGRTFDGYQREELTAPGGGPAAGIRNEVWIIPTVGCVNKTAERLASLANRELCPGDETFFAFTHPHGCSQLGDDQLRLQKILAGLVKHPNAGGVLVLGLGCENNNIDVFRGILGEVSDKRVKFLNAQDSHDEIVEGLELLRGLYAYVSAQKRVKLPLSALTVGLKCGGSDAFSGITANPAVGRLSDMLIKRGGSGVLTEVPEMFGAETILMNRAKNKEIFADTVDLINTFKRYYMRYGQPVSENPSPGNKAGGITTLEEKSLGCVQKGGTAPVSGVIGMGDQVSVRGLTLLDGPGNDIAACTNLTAAGCQLILFTTGRGTPLGAPVPTLKIASNSDIAARKPGWIDFDAASHSAEELFELVLKTASGEKVCNEKNGYREIAVFKDGVTL